MKLKRVISGILLLIILVSSVTSCAKTAEGLIEKADNMLQRTYYTVEVEFEYNTENEDVKDIFDQLDNVDTVIYFDNDDVKIMQSSSLIIDGENYELSGNYIVKDGTVYANSGYKAPMGSNFNKSKSSVSDDEKASLIEEAGLITGVGIEDFATVNLEKIDGEYFIRCSESSSDLNIRLERIMVSHFESEFIESVSVGNVRMTIEIDDGKYDTVTVLCDYNVKMYSKTYNVSAVFELEYDYDNNVKITMPSDAHEYDDVPFENILNTL